MKKIHLLLILASFSLNLFCQQDNIIIIDSTYTFRWDTVINDWFHYTRNIRTHDADGNQIETTRYQWDTETSEWIERSRNIHTYDADGNNTGSISSRWDPDINRWVNDTWYHHEYNSYGNQYVSINYHWDPGSNNWICDWKTVSYLSKLTTRISKNIIQFDYIVYPNPFSDYATIKLSDAVKTNKIELIDINGRIVRTVDKVSNNSVTIHREIYRVASILSGSVLMILMSRR